MGYKPDPPDPRDKTIHELAATGANFLPVGSELPSQASVAEAKVGIRHQGQTSSCVGFALSTAVRLAHIKDGRNVPELSPSFVYYIGRKDHQDKVTDKGTHIRSALKGIIRVGVPEERHWPFDPKKINRPPTWGAYRHGHDNGGVRGYYRIPRFKPDLIRLAIASQRPVVAGFLVDRAFVKNKGPSEITTPMDKKSIVGGHAMVIEAYDGDRFTLHNSWGTGWRNGGRVKVSSEFIKGAYDIWAIDT